MLRVSFAIVFVCLYSTATLAQETSHTFTYTELLSDFKLFRTAIETYHPSLYRYNSKDKIENYFLSAQKNIRPGMTEIEFWEILQHVTVELGSGHTNVFLSKQTISNYDSLGHLILPFLVCIEGDDLYVGQSLQGKKRPIPKGSKIISIDDVPSSIILSKFRDLVSGDGFSNYYKDYKLETGEFNLLYDLLFDEKNNLKIVLTDGIATNTLIVSTIKMRHKFPETVISSGRSRHKEPINLFNDNAYLDSLTSILSFTEQIPYSALLSLKNFTYKEYIELDKSIFKEISNRNISNLIIDLRNNTGGYDKNCIDLLKYLMPVPFQLTSNTESNIYLNSDELENDSFVNKEGKKIYHSKIYYPYKKEHFTGNIFLLINHGTFSDASLFAIALKSFITNVLIIGQETGGGRAGSDGLMFKDITLPNSSLIIHIPLAWSYSLSHENDRGVGLVPDILIRQQCSCSNDYNTIDSVLFKAQSLINPRKQ